jgi:integrase
MRDFYDNLGEREWSRLEETPRGRVAYEVHRQFLERFVRSGDRVLEIVAGPGRFTFDLARLGATVEVTDLSTVRKPSERPLELRGLKPVSFSRVRWRPRELRHSAASLMLAQGVKLQVVSQVLGHASIRMTADVYGHVLDPDRQEAAEAMGTLLWSDEG